MPASSRQATARPTPMSSARPTGTSATVMSTGVVRPIVIASRHSTAAHMPRRGDRSVLWGTGPGTAEVSLTAGPVAAASCGPRPP